MKKNGKNSPLVTQEPKDKNPFFNLQYMGYFLAGKDIDREDISLEDFAEIAKFYICREYGILMKDPIWDNYDHHAEVIKEYYAILYSKDKAAKEYFEASMDGIDLEDVDWMEEAISKNQEILKAREKELEDEITFDPEEEDDETK